jgi:hypothetical protein
VVATGGITVEMSHANSKDSQIGQPEIPELTAGMESYRTILIENRSSMIWMSGRFENMLGTLVAIAD